MDLKTRLAALRKGPEPVPASNAANVSTAPADVVARLQRASIRRQSPPPPNSLELAQALGGRQTAPGLIVIDRRLPLQAIRHVSPAVYDHLSIFLQGADVRLDECVFLDTETTGLAGGTGTLAFLVGIAKFEGHDLVLRQWLLTGFAGEGALLDDLSPWLTPSAVLVTFNGKSFDVPLLRTRYCLQRLHDPLTDCRHIDLYHATRRAFGSQWPDCKLQTAEQRLLQLKRIDDLPGFLIPEVWTSFVRSGRPGRLPAILDHNRQDVASLASLLGRLLQTYTQPGTLEVDARSLAAWLRSQQLHELAFAHLHRSRLELTPAGDLDLADHHRARSNMAAALPIWQRLAGDGLQSAMLRLAKYYEHNTKDYGMALIWTERMITRQGATQELQHRRTRLLKRLKSTATGVHGKPAP